MKLNIKIGTSLPVAGEANREFLARRSKRLRESGAALAAPPLKYLTGKTIKAFYLGLSEQYIDSKEIAHENALIAPVINVQGKPTSQSIYVNIPGVTINPTTDDYWTRGAPQTYYSNAHNKQSSVFVCQSLIELWHLKQFVEGDKDLNADLLFIASSQAQELPDEWYLEDFWRRFETIYLAYPNCAEGDENALKVSQRISQPKKRVRLMAKKAANWCDFCLETGNNTEEFKELLDEAKIFGEKITPESNGLFPGRYGYQPVDVAGSFHNGFLYYPARSIYIKDGNYRDEHGNSITEKFSRKEVVLIRSDRTEQSVVEVPAPAGTPKEDRVLRLTDGTVIESKPKASMHCTWSWKSIDEFLDSKNKTRSLGEILRDVKDFLRQSIWLPNEHDYDLLTLLVPVTFAQAIFQSVPLILVTGAPGSGKSALGKAMVSICSNASIVGQISAAAVARLIDETKGFVVFDDLESIGMKNGRTTPQFSELVQILKLSYNRETSWKKVTDTSSGMVTRELNFYGVKMINNTTGTDSILGSRLLKVFTRKIPNHIHPMIDTSDLWNPISLGKLRDELHCWTFENVQKIDQTYQRLFPSSSNRITEISAPLRVFAELSSDEEFQNNLAKAIEFQSTVHNDSINPVELMKEAVKQLVLAGFTQISSTLVMDEMKKLFSGKPISRFDESAKWKSPAWIGRQLRVHELVEANSPLTRLLVGDKFLRVYPLCKDYLDKVLSEKSKTL